MGAYLLYQNANRAQFKAKNPELSFGDLAKYTSQMYKTITTEEKSMWESKALEDKLRYQMELTSYVPPPGYDAKGNLLESAMSEKKRRRKMPKDPLAPESATEVQSNSNQEQMQQQEQMYQQQMYQQEYQQDLQREYQPQQEHMYVPQIPSHDKSIQYSMN